MATIVMGGLQKMSQAQTTERGNETKLLAEMIGILKEESKASREQAAQQQQMMLQQMAAQQQQMMQQQQMFMELVKGNMNK